MALTKTFRNHRRLNKMLKQLVTSSACFRKVDWRILCHLVLWKTRDLNIRKVWPVIILRDAQIVDDAGTMHQLACLLQILKSDAVLQGVESMLQNAKTALNCIPGANVGRVELLFGSVQLTTEGSDEPVVVRVSGITEDHTSWEDPFTSGLECFPEWGLTQDLIKWSVVLVSLRCPEWHCNYTACF